jgi:hypothetical protein
MLNCASIALPNVSAVMPVPSETKNTVLLCINRFKSVGYIRFITASSCGSRGRFARLAWDSATTIGAFRIQPDHGNKKNTKTLFAAVTATPHF